MNTCLSLLPLILFYFEWQATQKGDPLSALKKQLDDKEKQLSAEQENATAAKTRVRELTKVMSANILPSKSINISSFLGKKYGPNLRSTWIFVKELNSAKSKMTSVETRMSSELSAREQRIAALQASLQERLKATLQEHVLETEQLNSKVRGHQPFTVEFCVICVMLVSILYALFVALDPEPARAVGEWTKCSAGTSATGELYSQRCPQQGHQSGGEQVLHTILLHYIVSDIGDVAEM